MSAGTRYFIITETPDFVPHITPGCICFIREYKYLSQVRTRGNATKLCVFPLGSVASLCYNIEIRCMEEVSPEEAGLLLALEEDSERLRWFRERDAIQTALTLREGTRVTVENGRGRLKGIIRFIGSWTRPPLSQPLSGTLFGIELEDEDRGKGTSDGTHHYERLFFCEKDCGVLVPFSRVRPRTSTSSTPPGAHSSSAVATEELVPGDRVTYFVNDYCRHGMVVDVREKDGEHFVRISTDTDESGKTGGELEVPIQCVAKGEVPAEPEVTDIHPPGDPALGVNSLVQVSVGTGKFYGIIRWVGMVPGRQEVMAGLELEDNRGVSDGTFKKERFFRCPPRRALFVKLSSCFPDARFLSYEMSEAEDAAGCLDPAPPVNSEQVERLLIGRMKGIQGHCNSCYMDAALFSLFSCSSVLDSMLFKSTEAPDSVIQNTLLHDIVNPLRRRGFVEGQHVMKLRQQLQEHGYSHSFTTDEKDPEEFLTIIMHHILALEPLLKLSAGGKVQESYCYQIFLDQKHNLVLPTVQQLLEHSFHSGGLKLAEVPSCLILQMPRFGKKFKMFDKIIPSLELDITDLLSEGPQQCMLCGHLAQEECIDCFKDPVFNQTGFKLFCKTCSAQVHAHPQRRGHRPSTLNIPKGFLGRSAPHVLTRDKLELFAVLCIETSHYVSFIKFGPNSHDWIFFDSMADRQGEVDGFNIPEVHACPEVGTYLDMAPGELANQVPRNMKGVAKRLFCDAYMYLYQSPSLCLYR